MVLRAIGLYYNPVRCGWDVHSKKTDPRFCCVWTLLMAQGRSHRNPYHLVVALYAAQYLAATPETGKRAVKLAADIAAVIAPSVKTDHAIGPDGIHIHDGRIVAPVAESAPSQNVYWLHDIEEAHWKFYGGLRRLCDADPVALNQLKRYYGRASRWNWDDRFQETLTTFDSVWDLLLTRGNASDNLNPWHLIHALVEVGGAVGEGRAKPVRDLVFYLSSVLHPDVEAPEN